MHLKRMNERNIQFENIMRVFVSCQIKLLLFTGDLLYSWFNNIKALS